MSRRIILFLSLSRLNAVPVLVLRLYSCIVFIVLRLKHAAMFLLGWMIFCSPPCLILRIKELLWLMLSKAWHILSSLKIQRAEPSKLNKCFLSGLGLGLRLGLGSVGSGSGPHSCRARRQLPFFPDHHEEILEALQMRLPLISLTVQVQGSRGTLACQRSKRC